MTSRRRGNTDLGRIGPAAAIRFGFFAAVGAGLFGLIVLVIGVVVAVLAGPTLLAALSL